MSEIQRNVDRLRSTLIAEQREAIVAIGQFASAQNLEGTSPSKVEVLKALIPLLRSESLRPLVQETLSRFGTTAFQRLVVDVQRNHQGIARYAADALLAIEPDPKGIRFLVWLVAAVKRKSPAQRRLMFLSIRLAQANPASFAMLLTEKSVTTKLQVAEILWESGQNQGEVVAVAIELLGQEKVGERTLELLIRIGPEAVDAIPELLALAFAKPNGGIVQVLGAIGPSSISALTQ